MHHMTLRQLKAFALVAQHLSFARAASELSLTASAVSLRIKELEEAAGLPLFRRHGKTIALTYGGELLLVDVQRALLALRDASCTLSRLGGRKSGLVSVGMVSNAKYFFPRLLAPFHEQCPEVELQLCVGNREQLMEKLRQGKVDLAIMGAPPGEFEEHAEPFAAQPLGIVAAPEHPLVSTKGIPVNALVDHGFIVREPGSGTRAAMERFFSTARIEPRRVMELSSNEVIKQMVMSNMGLGFLSLHTVGLELQENLLALLDVVGTPLQRRWFVVRPAAKLDDAAETLRSFIIDHGGSHIAQQFGSVGFDSGSPAAPAAEIASQRLYG